ncbi:hypothetical protein [Ensifer sp.]|uniref:hypothetical protein n=1 Tax=Ensifer sp. TaxID=1872086 RepID=UPI0028A1CF70|nr:hypothetical protein [Ensifer sp.]
MKYRRPSGRTALFWFFVPLTIVAVLALKVPGIGILAALSIVGLPIAVLFWAAPALLLVSFTLVLVYRLAPAGKSLKIVLACVATAALFALPAALLNWRIENDVEAIAAADRNEITAPVTARAIAVRRWSNFDRQTTKCDGFCLHALLSGSADRVLVVAVKNLFAEPRLDESAIEFRLENRSICPSTRFQPGYHSLRLRNAAGETRDTNAVEAMNLSISNGRCLVQKATTLGDADLVISQGRTKRGVSDIEAGFDFSADTISTFTTSVHTVDRKTGLDEIYRSTRINYAPFAPLLLPGPAFGSEFRMDMGWFRLAKMVNSPSRYVDDDAHWVTFLTSTLGLQLALDDAGVGRRIVEKIEAAVAASRAPTPAEWEAFSTYSQKFGVVRDTKLSKREFDLALAILASPQFPPPPRLYLAVRYAESNEPAETRAKLADLLFARASAGQTWPDHLGVHFESSLGDLDIALAALSIQSLAPHFYDLDRLARDPSAQQYLDLALARLGAFGKDGVPALVHLIEVGLSGGQHFYQENRYQHPYLAGMKGLCRAGENGVAALPVLKRLLAEKQLPVHASYGSLLISTFARMGADTEHLWQAFQAIDPDANETLFQRDIKSAGKSKRDCEF